MTEQPQLNWQEMGLIVRQERARLLNELRGAETTMEAREACAAMLLSGEEALDGLTVGKLVEACRGVGPGRAQMILLAACVQSGTRVGSLRIKDAQRLAATLRGEC